jgi:septal ring factor EnvC (AmiA/AmiB activator)
MRLPHKSPRSRNREKPEPPDSVTAPTSTPAAAPAAIARRSAAGVPHLFFVFFVVASLIAFCQPTVAARHRASTKAPAAQSAPSANSANSASADPADLERLRSRIEALRGNLAGAEESRTEAADSLKESEQSISAANRGLYELNAQQRTTQARLRELGTQSKKAEAEIASQRDRLGKILARQALSGERDYFKLVFNGDDPNSIARDLTYYTYVSQAQANFIQSLKKSLKRVQELAGQTRDKSTELAGIETSQQQARRALVSQQNERRQVLDRIATQIRAQRKEMNALQRDETRLSKLIEGLGRIIAAEPRAKPGIRNEKTPDAASFAGELFAKLKGRLRLPVRGELTNQYGAKRSDGGVTWKGLFIRADPGTEVRAVAAGRVVFADWIRGFGNLAIVDHGQNYLSIYGNNETLLRQVGNPVAAGDAIATVGNSGGNPESGLYFELRYEGRAFDPMKWVLLK